MTAASLCAHATGTFKYLRAPAQPKGVKLQRSNAQPSE